MEELNSGSASSEMRLRETWSSEKWQIQSVSPVSLSSPGNPPVDQGGCKTSPPRGDPHPAFPRTGRMAASSALGHPWGLSLCHLSRVQVTLRGWVRNPGQPGCYGSAVYGLEIRGVVEKSCRDCLKSRVRRVLGVKLAAHFTELSVPGPAAGRSPPR